MFEQLSLKKTQMTVCSRINVIKVELCHSFEDLKEILFLEGIGLLQIVWTPKDI